MTCTIAGLNIDLANLALVVIALTSFLFTAYTVLEGKKAALFDLQLRVLLGTEEVQSEWYAIRNENNSIMHQVQMNTGLNKQQKDNLLEGLKSHGDFYEQCISDASAMAEDVQKNVKNFDQEKCQEYIKYIVVGKEKINRSRGVPRQKFTELMERYSQP